MEHRPLEHLPAGGEPENYPNNMNPVHEEHFSGPHDIIHEQDFEE
jgi:hypothetical protein